MKSLTNFDHVSDVVETEESLRICLFGIRSDKSDVFSSGVTLLQRSMSLTSVKPRLRGIYQSFIPVGMEITRGGKTWV